MESAVPLECKAGSLVILHGSLVHFSHQNKSEFPRPAYAFHVVDGECEWSADNWLQRSPDMPFRPM
jgi:phytanoyl-CoA hydroxylase